MRIQDEHFSSIEYHGITRGRKYYKLTADIRNQAKTKVKKDHKITARRIAWARKKENKEDFLQKIGSASGMMSVSAT